MVHKTVSAATSPPYEGGVRGGYSYPLLTSPLKQGGGILLYPLTMSHSLKPLVLFGSVGSFHGEAHDGVDQRMAKTDGFVFAVRGIYAPQQAGVDSVSDFSPELWR